MRKAHKLLAPILMVAAMATPARAEMFIATGLKLDAPVFTAPVGVAQTFSIQGAGLSNGAGGGWKSTSLNSYLAFYFMDQIGIHLSLDFGWANTSTDTPGNTGTINSNASFFQLGFGVGAKFYLTKPAKLKVSPYLWANFFKYIAAISTSNQAVTNDAIGFLASLSSPIGFELAFGAEYFLSPSFSIGAEILGLRFSHVDASQPAQNGGRQSVGFNTFTMYGAISLNYRFGLGGGGGGGGRAYEEDEERRPRPRPRRPPPPPEDGSPEQVE